MSDQLRAFRIEFNNEVFVVEFGDERQKLRKIYCPGARKKPSTVATYRAIIKVFAVWPKMMHWDDARRRRRACK